MSIDAFVRNMAVVLAAMALLSVVETVLPFFRKPASRRLHFIPNTALMALTLWLNLTLNAGAVLVAAWLTSRGLGLLSGAPLPPPATVLIGVIALDASTYVCHRLMHVLPALWRAHRVHHSDPLVDVTTALRFHPIETVWRFTCTVVPAWALGLPVEAVAIYRVVSVWVALLEHTNVKLWQPLDSALSLAVGTPNMHKVHHSRLAHEANTNYGNIFSLFDRMLGTFTPSARARSVDYGLGGYDDADSQQLRALLRLPFRGPSRSSAPQSPPRGASPIA
jgi:sterol desaturase/sphingolipid hydroxylase (fatty acid hydroxylase superfamily)